MDRIALDIETIPTVQDPDFNDPSHWVPFAAALGYQRPCGEVNVDVLFRDDGSVEAEAELFDSVLDWVAARCDGREDRELITYNGDSYDIPILQHRSYIVTNEISWSNATERLYLFIQTSDHVDLMQDMVAANGYHVSLDDALADHGIEADEPEWMGSKVTGADMPEMGLELLSDRPDGVNADLRDVVRRYAKSDVKPLFGLRDELRG